jgi:hypothetical protein
LDEAVIVLEEAVCAVEAGNNRTFEGWVLAELAEASLERGNLEWAEHEAQTAITVAHGQRSRFDDARAIISLVHIHRHRGDTAALAGAGEALVDETKAMADQPRCMSAALTWLAYAAATRDSSA